MWLFEFNGDFFVSFRRVHILPAKLCPFLNLIVLAPTEYSWTLSPWAPLELNTVKSMPTISMNTGEILVYEYIKSIRNEIDKGDLYWLHGKENCNPRAFVRIVLLRIPSDSCLPNVFPGM